MKTFQLLAIVLAALFFQLPDQSLGYKLTENEAIAQLLQEMIEQNEGTSELELEDNMAESDEERLLEETGGDVTVACSAKRDSVGLTYTRWGSSKCPSGASVLYAGRIAGSQYGQVGGGNYLCVPQPHALDNGDVDVKKPKVPRADRIGRLFGTEYEFPVRKGGHDQNAVCAVCYVQKRSAQVMIPGQASCPVGWTREYYGYLMGETNIPGHTSSEYICVDKAQDFAKGQGANTNGALLYHIAMSCNGFDCPPFSLDKVLSCSVCSK